MNAKDIEAIGIAISEGDVKTLIAEIIDLVLNEQNLNNIAYWLWSSSSKPGNIASYTSKLLPLLKNVALPLKVLGAVNKVPFFYDLVAAPKEVTYQITQKGGALDLYIPPSSPYKGLAGYGLSNRLVIDTRGLKGGLAGYGLSERTVLDSRRGQTGYAESAVITIDIRVIQ